MGAVDPSGLVTDKAGVVVVMEELAPGAARETYSRLPGFVKWLAKLGTSSAALALPASTSDTKAKEEEDNGLCFPVYRLGKVEVPPRGRSWAPTDPSRDRDFYRHYGIRQSWNPGNVMTSGKVLLRDIGITWIIIPAKGPDEMPLGNGFFEIIIFDPPKTVKDPQTRPIPPGFFNPSPWP